MTAPDCLTRAVFAKMRPRERTVAIIKKKPATPTPEAPTASLEIPNDLAEVARVRDFVRKTLAGLPLSEEDAFRIDLSLVEVCINIALYAYPGGRGHISLRSWHDSSRVYYEVRDSGAPFDPRSLKKPDLRKIMRTARKGGFGVFLSRRMMDGFDYRRERGQNVLTLSKKLRSSKRRRSAA